MVVKEKPDRKKNQKWRTRANVNKLHQYIHLTLSFSVFPFHPPENINFLCFQGPHKGTLGKQVLKPRFGKVILCLRCDIKL